MPKEVERNVDDGEPPLTPWNAPIGGPKGIPISAAGLQFAPGKTYQLGPTVKLHTAPAEPVKPPTRWQKAKRFPKSLKPYAVYLIIIATQVAVWILTPGHHEMNAGAIGLNIGLMLATFTNEQTKKMDDMMRKIDDDYNRTVAKIEAEHEVRQRYEAKYGPL